MVLRGSAPDGGLYVPSDTLPFITRGELSRLVNMDYKSRALLILEKLVHPNDVSPSALRNFIQAAYSPGDVEQAL
jgi:threonine synthase